MELIKDFKPYKMNKADKFDFEDFVNNDVKKVMTIIQEYRLPWIHVAQLGINKNIALMHRDKGWFAICNPRYTPAKSSRKRKINEASFSHILSEPPKITTSVFQTQRHMIVRGLYDTYTEKGQLVPDSDKFTDGEAVILQAISDIADGLDITRFPMYIPEVKDNE